MLLDTITVDAVLLLLVDGQPVVTNRRNEQDTVVVDILILNTPPVSFRANTRESGIDAELTLCNLDGAIKLGNDHSYDWNGMGHPLEWDKCLAIGGTFHLFKLSNFVHVLLFGPSFTSWATSLADIQRYVWTIV